MGLSDCLLQRWTASRVDGLSGDVVTMEVGWTVFGSGCSVLKIEVPLAVAVSFSLYNEKNEKSSKKRADRIVNQP